MKYSLDWLSEFVPLDGISRDELEDRITTRTAEVEGIEEFRRDLTHKRCGRVVDVETTASGPSVVRVDLGDGVELASSSAADLVPGQRVVFANVGAVLADRSIVRERSIDGRVIRGVLCNAADVGLGAAKQLALLPPSVALGAELSSVLEETDSLIEIDNKSLTHRPDLWGHYGMARELAAIFGRPLRKYEMADLPASDALPALPIEVEDTDLCPVYSACGFEVDRNGPSPLRVQRRLAALGISPSNLLVDVTNFVQYELGQPTHAFDAENVRSIRVALAGDVRRFETLDGSVRKLDPQDLMIFAGDTPIALAGIMGGLGSRVRAETRAVILESANFAAPRVRRTSIRLDLRTDASLRFEKKPPLVYARWAAGRVLHELASAGVEVVTTKRYSMQGDPRDRSRRIVVPARWIDTRAGAQIGEARSAEILRSIGFEAEVAADGSLVVDVPAFRSEADISTREDLSEEVFRLFGYENITPIPPSGPLAPVPPHVPTRSQHRVRRVLAQGHGFVEVQTAGWFSDEWLARLPYTPEAPLRIRNPRTATRAQMRDDLMPNLLQAAHQSRHAQETLSIFEIGRVFRLDSANTKHEFDRVGGLIVGAADADPAELLLDLRGTIDDAAAAAGHGRLKARRIRETAAAPWFDEASSIELRCETKAVGAAGLLPVALASALQFSGPVAWFFVELSALAGKPFPEIRYRSPPKFPGSSQDFTFVWSRDRGYQELERVLDEFRHPAIADRSFVVYFDPKSDETSRYTFRYTLLWPDRTPTNEDTDEFRGAFLEFMQARELQLA